MLLKGVNVVSYNVSDWEGAKRFYNETLGLPEIFLMDDIGWAEYGNADEAHIAISRSETPPGQDGGATVVFTVDDAHAAVEELRSRGVRVGEVVVIPGMVAYADFFDPEGNRLQVVQSLGEGQ